MKRFSELAGIFAAIALFLVTFIAAEAYVSDQHQMRADLLDGDD